MRFNVRTSRNSSVSTGLSGGIVLGLAAIAVWCITLEIRCIVWIGRFAWRVGWVPLRFGVAIVRAGVATRRYRREGVR